MRARRGYVKPSAALTMEEMLKAVHELDPPKGINQLVLPTAAPGRLLNKATSFIDEHRIRGYEVGPDQRTNILTIANLLQEVAGNHGVALWGRGKEGYATDPFMVELNLIFAAARIQIQMDRYPSWGDVLQIETWFQAEGQMAACRNWIIKDVASGDEIGRATSTWVLINSKTRRMEKIPEVMKVKLEKLAPKPKRHSVPLDQQRRKIPELKEPFDIIGPLQVARRSDMDMNGHINNVTYLSWALETVPRAVYTDYDLIQIEIDYKNECLAGHTVETLGNFVDEETNGSGLKRYTHMLRKCEEDKCEELVRARTTWRPDTSGEQRNFRWAPEYGNGKANIKPGQE